MVSPTRKQGAGERGKGPRREKKEIYGRGKKGKGVCEKVPEICGKGITLAPVEEEKKISRGEDEGKGSASRKEGGQRKRERQPPCTPSI